MVDRITKQAAIAISRRNFLAKALVAAASVGALSILGPLPALAFSCNSCTGLCSSCQSHCSVCSPSGAYCYYFTCTCPPGCWQCGNFLVSGTVCDDGGYSVSCSGC